MKQLDPKAVWLFFIQNVFRWILVLVLIGFPFSGVLIPLFIMGVGDKITSGVADISLNGLWLVPVFILIISFISAKLKYHFIRYELAELGFRKESGVILKKYVTIPYARIQNVDIHRGLLSRILGLSDLKIQTAGMSAVMTRYGAAGIGAEGSLPALSETVAEELRDELIRRSQKSPAQGL